MNGRLWYPQLDVYSSIRRLGGLLLSFETPPGIERLCIADFFFANPPLLYRCTMSRGTRSAFSSLRVVRPEKSFLHYPAAPLLFNKMEPIQREALHAMAGKAVLSMEALQTGVAELTAVGTEVFKSEAIGSFTLDELALIRFLTRDFAPGVDGGSDALRRSAGIRRFR